MSLEIIHPGLGGVSKAKLKDSIAKTFKQKSENVVVYGLNTDFGGTRSTGFCLVYENQGKLKTYEPKYRLRRMGILPNRTGSRKMRKELKNRKKKVRGVKKNEVGVGKKKN